MNSNLRQARRREQLTDYDLSQLSSRSFEQLLQALAAKVLGPGVGVFGDGPDGGREATFHGKVPYPYDDDSWEGYGVLQAKFRQRSGNVKEDGDWAVTQLKSEIKKYFNSDNNLRNPEYFIYATNVVLTPAHEKGSKDRVEALLEDFKHRVPLKGFDIWDYDKIRVFLDDNYDIRQAYTAWITPGDVLAEIVKRLVPKTPNFRSILHNFVQKELLSDEYVNLEQAGHDIDERISLAQVFVDLPIVDEPHRADAFDLEDGTDYRFEDRAQDAPDSGFIKAMLAVSAERLDPKTLASETIGQRPRTRDSSPTRGRFVLIGGPGQGKTTVGQFICQIFRASIISRRPQHLLSAEINSALSLISNHCQEEAIDHSLVPRFPFRIVLNEFASALSSDSLPHINSVLSYIANQIHKRTGSTVSIDDMKDWFTHYPSIIIFDGLDEVPSSSNRDQVLEAIRDFWIDASNANADILSIATTRPQGYNEDFSPTLYQHQRLAPLSKELGKHFARRLADVRYGSDMDRKDKVLGRLDRSFENESTSRLMRSPLQVTIMTALVDRIGQPPQARWNLFKAYYDVIYQREVERDIPASSILRQYQPDINAIHSRVGLLLQIDSERSGRTDAKLSTQRFMSLVKERLEEEGHEGQGLDDLTQQILDAAAQRLVFLVGLESDQVGFEIRSLQEFMAAECLMEGRDEDVQRRLLEIAPLPNWRNVFLFASGKCFGERQHLRDTIHRICATLNETDEDEVAGQYLVGSGLAMDLLVDGLSRHQPKFVHSLARIAIRALDVPNTDFQIQLASVYEEQLQAIYAEEMARRLRDKRESVRLGTWNCLIRLIARDFEWARQLADEYWPSEPESQIIILQASVGFWRNHWSAAKFLEMMPQYPVRRIRELYFIGTATVYGSNLIHQMRVSPPKSLSLLPHQEAMIKLLDHDIYEERFELELLGDRFYGISTMKVPGDESFWFFRLQDLGDCHPTWALYQSAARFLKNPSKRTLAQELRTLAPLLNSELHHSRFWSQPQVPWPLAACINLCDTEMDTLDLARKAETGQLGDRDDWLAAEHRWRTVGVTEHDIISMSDERLPFDSGIGSEGFPTALSFLPAFPPPSEDVGALRKLLSLHGQMKRGKARAVLAGLIEACFVRVSMFIAPDEAKYPITLDAAELQSVFEDLPSKRSVPLHTVVNVLSGSDQDILELFRVLIHSQVDFAVYAIPGIFHKDRLHRLKTASLATSGDQLLMPVFGALAENGQLPPKFVSGVTPEDFGVLEQKIASVVIMLAQEPWKTDRTALLIGFVKDVAYKSPKETHRRIMNTLEENRSTGPWFEQFLVEFGKLLSPDSYDSKKRYALLLENALRRRTSRFSDDTMRHIFNMPVGITELL